MSRSIETELPESFLRIYRKHPEFKWKNSIYLGRDMAREDGEDNFYRYAVLALLSAFAMDWHSELTQGTNYHLSHWVLGSVTSLEALRRIRRENAQK